MPGAQGGGGGPGWDPPALSLPEDAPGGAERCADAAVRGRAGLRASPALTVVLKGDRAAGGGGGERQA